MPFRPERTADEFIGIADKCRDLSELGGALADIAAELGFDYYALLHHASLNKSGPRLVQLLDYPDGWLDEYKRLGFSARDPIHFASARVNTGFCWDDAGSLMRLGECHKSILARSRHFGLGEGFTVPANIPGEPHASCSFAVRAGRALPVRHLRCAELVGAYAFRTARRILGPATAFAAPPHLSRRELECVELVAQGKTDFEISLILGISRATVSQYIKRSRAAYDVVTRTQLAVRAIADGRILPGGR